LRTNVYRLRKVLYDQCIVVRGDSYDVDPTGHFWYDLHYFKELVKRSRQSNCSPLERLMLLESAVKLYQGPFLEEVASDWCVAERYDMEIRYTSAALALATTYVENQDYLEAVEICERLLAIDEFNEDAVLLVVRSHLALGDRSTAMLHWRSFERRLQSEGGTSPSRQASSQYELLLRAS
jgi:LuxR family transcriptional regulator, maltose regulon positive regulatory protein